MTNKPERSIEEIVEELKRRHPCIVTDKMAIGNQSELYIDVFDSFTQTLQAERQKREEEVEKERERIAKIIQNRFPETMNEQEKEKYHCESFVLFWAEKLLETIGFCRHLVLVSRNCPFCAGKNRKV